MKRYLHAAWNFDFNGTVNEKLSYKLIKPFGYVNKLRGGEIV